MQQSPRWSRRAGGLDVYTWTGLVPSGVSKGIIHLIVEGHLIRSTPILSLVGHPLPIEDYVGMTKEARRYLVFE